MHLELEVHVPGDPTFRFRLEKSRSVIGRGRDCDLVLLDRHSSRTHAEIQLKPDGTIRIRDLKSMNGIYVNGERVREREIDIQDRIRIGDTILVICSASLVDQSVQAYSPAIQEEETDRIPMGDESVAISRPLQEIEKELIRPQGAGLEIHSTLPQSVRKKLYVLHELGRQISHVYEKAALFQALAEIVREAVVSDVLTIHSVEEEGFPTILERSWNETAAWSGPGLSLLRDAVREKAILLNHLPNPQAEDETSQTLVAPILVDREPMAVLAIGRMDVPPTFTREDLDIMGIVAAQAGMVMAKCKLFSEVHQSKLVLADKNFELQRVNSELARTNAELARKNAELKATLERLQFEETSHD